MVYKTEDRHAFHEQCWALHVRMDHMESPRDVLYYRVCSITFPWMIDIRHVIQKMHGVVFVHQFCLYAHMFVRTLEWVHRNRMLFVGMGRNVNALLDQESTRLSALPRAGVCVSYYGDISPF